MEPEILHIPSTDQFLLSARLYRSADAKGIIQINSATGVKKEFYHHFACYLQSQNFHVVTFDYRGIGGSRPTSLRGFQAQNHEWGKKDMTAVLDWIEASFPALKKYIIGHSAGGQQLGWMSNHDRIEKAFLVGCSVGYVPYLTAPYRYFAAFAFHVLFPATIPVFGYVPVKRFGLGEDLPKGVAWEWRKWCLHPNYFGEDLQTTLKPHYFDKIKYPIHALYLEDDPIANTKTVNELLQFYSNAPKTTERVLLKDVQAKKVGHFGFFSRALQSYFWHKPVSFFNS